MASWISQMFPDLFGGSSNTQSSSDFREFENSKSRPSTKYGGSLNERLDRGQTIYRSGAPTPGAKSPSIDDQTRNLDVRGTGKGVNFFGYGQDTKANPLGDAVNISTNPSATGRVKISGFTTKASPKMISDYGGGENDDSVKIAADKSVYRNDLNPRSYGREFTSKGIRTQGESGFKSAYIDKGTEPVDNSREVQRKMDFVSYGEALDGQGDGYVSYKFSQEYTNLNTGPYAKPTMETWVPYPAYGNVNEYKYLPRLQGLTNNDLGENLSVGNIGGPFDKLSAGGGSDGGTNPANEKRRIVSALTKQSGDIGSAVVDTGGSFVEVENSSISNSSPLLVGKKWGAPLSVNKNFKDQYEIISKPPTGEGKATEEMQSRGDNRVNGVVTPVPSTNAEHSKILSRVGMSLTDRINNPYHKTKKSPPGSTEEQQGNNDAGEQSLPRSKAVSYVDLGIGKSVETERLDESLKKFGTSYTDKLRQIGQLGDSEDLKVYNDIKSLVDLKRLAESSFNRRTKESADLESPDSGPPSKTYNQRFLDNPYHLNKRNIPNYTGIDRKDPFNLKSVLDAEDHSMNTEPEFASQDFISLYWHDLVNKKYIPFRAFITGMSDQADATWQNVQYLGRADSVHIYQGFTRQLSCDVRVVALSVEELHPMWQRINYMVGLTKPASYTEHGFIIPPFVRFNLGDIYRNQPVLITSVAVEIPAEASWELVNNEKANGQTERDKYEFAAGDIKRSNVKVAKYPTTCDLKVSMTVLEKFTPETKENHFGNHPLHAGDGNGFNQTLTKYNNNTQDTQQATQEQQQSAQRGLDADQNASRQRTQEERQNSLSSSSRRSILANVARNGI